MGKISNALFDLKGKVAVITGGAGMLGTEYAIALSDAGASVVLFDIKKPDELEKHAATLEKDFGVTVTAISVDVSDEAGVKNAVAEVMKKFKRIDILVNNAALTDFVVEYNRFAPFESFATEVWKKEIDVCLNGTFLCTRTVAPIMMENHSGVIVNISSLLGHGAPHNRMYDKGKYRSMAYGASKAGILNFTQSLAAYLAPYGIRVNSLSPGGVFAGALDQRFYDAYSSRTMLGRMAKKEEYRGPMLFLCSDASSYMTGADLAVDAGWTAW